MKCPNCNANLDINPNDDESICPQCNTVLHKSIGCIYPTHPVYTPKEYREKKITLLIMSLLMLFVLAFSVFFDTSKNYSYSTSRPSYDTSNNYNTQWHSYHRDSLKLLFIFILCISCSVSYMKTGDEAAKFWGLVITVLAGIFGLIFLIRYLYGNISLSDYFTYFTYFF